MKVNKLHERNYSTPVPRFLVGIDEVGRGPIAGPVTVCAFAVPTLSVDIISRDLKNSKALSAKSREEWYAKFRDLTREGKVFYKVASVSHTIIDRKGITFAIRLALMRALSRLIREISNQTPSNSPEGGAPSPLERVGERFYEEALIFLDGGLRAPAKYKNQKTIIKGDEKVPVIAAASIVAKVERDRKMSRLGLVYLQYGFDRHKGYGTRAHYRALKKYGPSPIHRKTFL